MNLAYTTLPTQPLARRAEDPGEVVLIVHETPEQLAPLRDALEESGYTVVVATGAEGALQQARDARPDIVLVDTLLTGTDGFGLARRLQSRAATAHTPIIFLSNESGTDHIVAALEAGGVDCLVKPIRPREVLARIGVHLAGARRARQEARQAGQARNALDAFGYASMTVRAKDGRLLWQTALARELLATYFGAGGATVSQTFAPEPVVEWLQRHHETPPAQIEPPRLTIQRPGRRLSFTLHQQTGDSEGAGDWLIVMREECDSASIQAMRDSFKLTGREAEVLYWVVKGKINRDVADILGSSPATVKKQLEHVFAKLGVETRTAAAAMAIERIRPRDPRFAH